MTMETINEIVETSTVEENMDENPSTNHNDSKVLAIDKPAELGSLNSESETADAKKKRKKKRRRGKKDFKDKDENSTSEKDLNLNKDTNVEINEENDIKDNNENMEKTSNCNITINEPIKKNKLPFRLAKEKDYFEVPGGEIVGGSYSRVVIIGDSFILDYSKLWPSNSKIKPYFLYKNKLSIDELFVKFHDHLFLKNSPKILVLFVLGLHDFSEYATFLKASCTGNHLFTEYLHDGKNFNSLHCRRFIQKLVDTKENFEVIENLSVSFSYFPELKNIRNLRTVFNAFPEDMPNCTCLCRNLGDLPGKIAAAHFGNTVFNINRKLSAKQLNSPKDKSIFEYMPPTVSFVNGTWRLTRPRECSQDDVLMLNFLLKEYIYGDVCANISKEANEVKRLLALMRTRIWRCKFRFILIGDTWIDFIARQWPMSNKIVPYFYFAENLTLNDFCKVIVSLVRKEEIGLVITALPAGELFTVKSSSRCDGHKRLEYPVPNENILKDPINYAQQLIKKINKFLEEMKQVRNCCGVVFTTCYPIKLSSYYDHLSKVHTSSLGEKRHPESEPVIDVDFSDYDKKLSQCLDVINQYIITSHRNHELPLCNIYKAVKSSNEEIIFPTYIEGQCPAKSVKKDLFSCVKNYVVQFYDLCNARKLTFTQPQDMRKKASKRREVFKNKHNINERNESYRRMNRNRIVPAPSSTMNRNRIVPAPPPTAVICERMRRLNISSNQKFFNISADSQKFLNNSGNSQKFLNNTGNSQKFLNNSGNSQKFSNNLGNSQILNNSGNSQKFFDDSRNSQKFLNTENSKKFLNHSGNSQKSFNSVNSQKFLNNSGDSQKFLNISGDSQKFRSSVNILQRGRENQLPVAALPIPVPKPPTTSLPFNISASSPSNLNRIQQDSVRHSQVMNVNRLEGPSHNSSTDFSQINYGSQSMMAANQHRISSLHN